MRCVLSCASCAKRRSDTTPIRCGRPSKTSAAASQDPGGGSARARLPSRHGAIRRRGGGSTATYCSGKRPRTVDLASSASWPSWRWSRWRSGPTSICASRRSSTRERWRASNSNFASPPHGSRRHLGLLAQRRSADGEDAPGGHRDVVEAARRGRLHHRASDSATDLPVGEPHDRRTPRWIARPKRSCRACDAPRIPRPIGASGYARSRSIRRMASFPLLRSNRWSSCATGCGSTASSGSALGTLPPLRQELSAPAPPRAPDAALQANWRMRRGTSRSCRGPIRQAGDA